MTVINHVLRKNHSHFENTKPFSSHDLRRTATSQMIALGIHPLIIDKILNHTEDSASAFYEHHTSDNEKKQALEKWGEIIEALVNSYQ